MNELPPPTSSTSDDRLWIVLCHLSALLGVGIVLPLIVYLVKKDDSPRVAGHAREALNFHISILIYMIVCVPFVFVFVGIPMAFILGVSALVFAVLAAVQSSKGVDYRYPLTLRLI